MEIQINKFGAETYKVPEGTKGKITGIFQSPNGFVSYKLDLEGEGVLTSNGERRKDTYLGEDKIIPVVTPEPKEPHEMTRAEFNENPDNPFLANKDEEFRNNVHKTRVMAAIKEGKAIPPEVLKDYPGLQPQITKVHDDGDLTVKDKGANFVVTTEGKTFKEVAPPPEMKATIHTSHELGEQATQGRAEAARDAHNVEAAGSNPAPAIKSPEQPMREGHPISQAENRAIHAWYGEHGESKPKVEEEEKHEPIQTPGGEWRHDGKNWRFHKTATHNAKPAKMPSSVMHPGKVHNTPSPKGSPKPHMSMVRKGKMVVIKGVGTANVKHLPKGRILRKRK